MDKVQNACLMTTLIDDNTGKTILTYIPIHVDLGIVEYFLDTGTCTNKLAVSFELETDGESYWNDMWNSLEAACD